MKRRLAGSMAVTMMALALSTGIAFAGEASGDLFLESVSEAVTEEMSESISDTLPEGEYIVDVETDSSMFHVNEAMDGKGTLTVKDGEMTLHISLASKNILNLFPGSSEEAKAEGAKLLMPTVDELTYSDGMTEEVYGFDIPVEALDEEFPVAIIGKKGKWYDHTVKAFNPVRK